VPADLRKLIVEMAMNNPTWGEERIANELLLKIGVQISPRTIRRYIPKNPRRPADPAQRWMTFVRNHTKAIIAADFFVVVTATFRLAYVFMIMELDTRRILHSNVTQHPAAEWTLQQFRECVTVEEGYRFIIHDRDRIYSCPLDQSLKSLGLTVLKTPYKSPQANTFASACSVVLVESVWTLSFPSTKPTSGTLSDLGLCTTIALHIALPYYVFEKSKFTCLDVGTVRLRRE